MKPTYPAAVFTAAFAVVLATNIVSADAATAARVSLTFDTPSGSLGSAQTSFSNLGSASVRISTVSVNGGRITSQESRSGQGDAVAFPPFDSRASGPRAVLRVTSSGSPDVLSPGSADFSWGADFTMSSGATANKSSTSHDNGDNLVQRGLYDQTQYKLQLDGHQPLCRLRGSTGAAGAVAVVVPVTVTPDTWYGATCQRTGETLSINVVKYDSAGVVVATWSASQSSPVGFGSIVYSPSSVPMSVGGKLANNGAIVTSASDQFNGTVDNVFFATSN